MDQYNQQPNTLVFGILGLVFGTVLGIIFGAIGRSKGKAYIARGGTLTGASKVGFILSKVALILGIIGVIVVILCLVVLLASGDFNEAISEINSLY